MRLIQLAVPLLLAVVAGVVALAPYSSSLEPAQTLFQQGALRPLLKGEEALTRGQGDQALALFGLVVLRAKRASAGTLLEKTDTRLASGGYALWQRDRRQGWPLLSHLVLWSGDYGMAASVVEAKLLRQAPAQTVFRYELMDEGGKRSAWGRTPFGFTMRLPIAVPDRFLQAREAWTYNFAQSPPPATVRRLLIYKLDDRTVTGGEGWRLEIAVEPHSSNRWYASLDNTVRWGDPLLERGVSEASVSLAKPGFFAVDRLVAADPRRNSLLRATLVHEYSPLS
jgi:hypothetical protein